MRVLVVGEGAHEIPSAYDRPAEADAEPRGALGVLVRRLLGDGHTYHYRSVKEAKPARRLRGAVGGRGMKKRALHWLLQAETHQFDAVVLVVDEDGDSTRVSKIDDAQQSAVSATPRALGVAIRSFDAWMLADEQALSTALGHPVQMQRDPETIKDPKAQCKALHEESPTDDALREVYEVVAAETDLTTLRERCPRGFGPFADRVEALNA